MKLGNSAFHFDFLTHWFCCLAQTPPLFHPQQLIEVDTHGKSDMGGIMGFREVKKKQTILLIS